MNNHASQSCTVSVFKLSSSKTPPVLCGLATINAADDEPDEDPPGAEEGDDAVQEMVGTVSLHVRLLDNLHIPHYT